MRKTENSSNLIYSLKILFQSVPVEPLAFRLLRLYLNGFTQVGDESIGLECSSVSLFLWTQGTCRIKRSTKIVALRNHLNIRFLQNEKMIIKLSARDIEKKKQSRLSQNLAKSITLESQTYITL